MTSIQQVVEELRDVLKQLFGILLDARQGFHHVSETTAKVQAQLVGTVPGATKDSLDASPYFYGDAPPQNHPYDPAASWLHQTTQGELKVRNLRGGLNDAFIGNMCLVQLYTYWEDHYRAQVAAAQSLEKNAVKTPIFGDIRLLRNSIVHHRGIALEEVGTCQLLKWFKKGDQITISTAQFRQLAKGVSDYLDSLVSTDGTAAA